MQASAGARALRPRTPRPAEAPCLGIGVGLRPKHYAEAIERGREGRLGVDWFEALTENYMVAGGRLPRVLDEVRGLAPVVLHGVSMNLGSVDPLDRAYLDDLDALARRVEPPWVSDHLCWTGVDGRNLHDLLPLPYTEEAVEHVSARIRRVQDRLGRRIAVENVSSYVEHSASTLCEWEFLGAVAERADCGILLDVNNVFVSAHNHGFDAEAYLDAIDPARVFQIHLAGHGAEGPLLIDSHDHPVRDEVWALYAHALRRLGPVSTLIEWDGNLPDFERLCEEAARARAILAGVLESDARPGRDATADRATAGRA
jgi:uncharacterized protein (UPF0276 family)